MDLFINPPLQLGFPRSGSDSLVSSGKRKSPFAVYATTNGHVWVFLHPPASREGIVKASSQMTICV
jgi:hypothetical protein